MSTKKPTATQLRAAADRLDAWVLDEAGGTLAADLAMILAHYRQSTKRKVSRKGLYVKGRAYEYELRDELIAAGLECRRVMQSGGGVEKDDLVMKCGWGEESRLEAKRRGKLPAYLTEALDSGCAASIFREDGGKSYALITLTRFIELCQ